MVTGEMDRRKRRIDLLLSERLDEAHSQRLANGKYVCLICPSRPVVDTLPMLTMHNQGTRHQAQALKLKEKEISKQEEIQKRIALYEPSVTNNDTFNAHIHCTSSFTSPLLKKTRKSTADVLANSMNTSGDTSMPKGDQPFVCKKKPFFASLYDNNVKTPDKKTESPVQHLQVRTDGNSNASVNLQSSTKAVSGTVNEQQVDFQKQREKDLKFREAGWRRDGQGNWFREENGPMGCDKLQFSGAKYAIAVYGTLQVYGLLIILPSVPEAIFTRHCYNMRNRSAMLTNTLGWSELGQIG